MLKGDQRRKRLRDMLDAAHTNATQASLAIGRSKDYLRDYLTGRKQDISADEWEQLVEMLPPPPPPAQPSPSSPDERRTNARRTQALALVFRYVLDRLADHPQDREELADPAFRRQVAKVFALAATAPLNPDAILGDENMVQQAGETWLHTLAHQEADQ